MTALTPFKVIQGHWYWYHSKAHLRLAMSDCLILTYILSLTISKLLQIISLTYAFERESTAFQHARSRWIPKLTTTKFVLKKLETSLYRVVQNVFRDLEPFSQRSRVWRTDIWTSNRSLLTTAWSTDTRSNVSWLDILNWIVSNLTLNCVLLWQIAHYYLLLHQVSSNHVL